MRTLFLLLLLYTLVGFINAEQLKSRGLEPPFISPLIPYIGIKSENFALIWFDYILIVLNYVILISIIFYLWNYVRKARI
jgi:hypothetical protein